jgi:predicted  nucleic acid-binding Zn-ribbon protein
MAHQKEREETVERLKHVQAEIKKLDLESETRREKIARLRRQQLELKTNKEFKTMESEIQGIETEISGIEDQELALMERVETARAELSRAEQALKEEEARVRSDAAALDERAAGISAALEKARGARDALAVDVDPEWLAAYTRIFQRKSLALVRIEDGICSGCHMKLPPYAQHDARKQSEMVVCTSCGRLLYS